jgi:hypothetical protein
VTNSRKRHTPITLKDVGDQLEFIANYNYLAHENYDEVHDADMDYLFKLEDAYKSGNPIQWGAEVLA